MTAVSPPALSRLLHQHTQRQKPALIPELELHLSSALIPLWEGLEAQSGAREEPPFWAFAWAGGQALARFVLDQPGRVRGKRVFDFATGGGLVALAAAYAGASSVLAVDIDPLALAVTETNASGNGLTVSTSRENWIGKPVLADVLLAGDICYERRIAEQVIEWFFALSESGVDVLVGDGGRAFLPRDRLRLEATYAVPTTIEIESAAVREGTVWSIPQ